MDRIVVANLWSGGDAAHHVDFYEIKDVLRLKRGVKRCITNGRLVMLVDDKFASIMEAKGIDYFIYNQDQNYGGWSLVCQSWHPKIASLCDERYITVGLDTIFVNNCDWLFDWDFSDVGLPIDPYHETTICDAIIVSTKEGANIIWKGFLESTKNYMRDHLLFGKASEMVLLRDLWAKHKWDILPGPPKLISYKCHTPKYDWKQASLVYFHGNPKPNDLPDGELKKLWLS